jgi:hypothetical protein
MDAHKIRNKAIHRISYECAWAAGLTYEELTGFVAGAVQLTDEQLWNLAEVLGMKLEDR